MWPHRPVHLVTVNGLLCRLSAVGMGDIQVVGDLIGGCLLPPWAINVRGEFADWAEVFETVFIQARSPVPPPHSLDGAEIKITLLFKGNQNQERIR